jgi:hypothetical protein
MHAHLCGQHQSKYRDIDQDHELITLAPAAEDIICMPSAQTADMKGSWLRATGAHYSIAATIE